jgi:multiple sugar transport system substrate-binding protein
MGLPYASNTAVLLYNKDIFDRFGVPYPKDGITFNQTVELSKKLTRLHEGTQYYGMVPSNLKPMVEQLSIDKINLKTHEANFINDGMKKIMQHQLDIYNIPGYDFNKITFQQGAKFFRDKNIGMVSTAFLGLTLLYSKDLAAMNWDMVTTPQWEDRPGIGTKVDAHSFQISRESKHKEQAYLAIEYLTASKEAQTNFSRSGWISVLKDPEIINQLSADNPVMKGKNMVKAISLKPAPNLIFHEYENLVVPKLLNVVKQMVVEKVDINTALRTNQEELTKDIKARMKK